VAIRIPMVVKRSTSVRVAMIAGCKDPDVRGFNPAIAVALQRIANPIAPSPLTLGQI